MQLEQIRSIITVYTDKYRLQAPRDCFNMIMEHIDLLQNDKKLPEFDMDFVVGEVRRLVFSILSDDLSFEHLQFIEAFSELIFNWNSNIENSNQDIDLYTQILKRQVETAILLKNTITVIKESNERWQTLATWSPPAYDMSKAYLKSLLDKYDKNL